MKGLKQSTSATVLVGPVLDSTGAAVTNAVVGDFRLAKNGTVATLSGATVTHDANGYYLIALTTGNTDTTGRLVLTSGNTAHSMASHHWSVLPASVFDAIYTNATNSTGGLATATGTITALAGAVSTLTAPQVRTELATELGRIDVATSTRMATYTQPTGFLGSTFPTTVASPTNITQASGVTLAAVTHTGATIPTVTNVTNGVTVSDKTGFKLASDGLAQVTSWTVAITGNITGNVTGSVGSISGVTFPANFELLGIDGSGAILNVVTVVTVDELGANALTANGAGDPIETYVWGALLADNTTANTFGARVVRSLNSNNTVQITGGGSYHIFSVLHDAEADSIPEDAFVTGALSARVLASDAATEIANAVAATQALSRLDSMIESDGAGQFRFDTIALSMAPAGGGGGGGTDWTANERTAIRAILGIPTSGTTPTDPTEGILDEIRDQTALIQAGGTVTVSTPVTASGQLASPLIIGDDYLAANGRGFRWTVPLPPGFVIATSTCKFGMRYEDDQGVNSFIKTGTVSDAGNGNVHLDFDLTKAIETGLLRPGWYDWSVEIASASGTEITRVKSGKNAEWQEKQT
jgi:hypothetical protein